jgi:hypothetical protein
MGGVADKSRLEICKQPQNLRPTKPSLQGCSPGLINTVHLEHVLRQIEPDNPDCHDVRLSLLLTAGRSSDQPTVGKSGAVHTIMVAATSIADTPRKPLPTESRSLIALRLSSHLGPPDVTRPGVMVLSAVGIYRRIIRSEALAQLGHQIGNRLASRRPITYRTARLVRVVVDGKPVIVTHAYRRIGKVSGNAH